MRLYAESLHDELFGFLIAELSKISPTIGFVASLLFCHRLNTIELHSKCQSLNCPPSFPIDFLCSQLQKLSSSITKLDLEEYNINDRILSALAASPAAQHLKYFRALGTFLTDYSSEIWPSFSNLQVLILNDCPNLGDRTFRSITKLHRLNTLKLWKDDAYSESLAFLTMLLQPNVLLELHSIKMGGIGHQECLPVLISLMRNATCPERFESVLFRSWNAYESVPNMEILQSICPQLRYDPGGSELITSLRKMRSGAASNGIVALESNANQASIDGVYELAPQTSEIRTGTISSALDFSKFGSLRSLSFSGSFAATEYIKVLPASLKKFVCMIDTGITHASSLDPLVDLLSRSCLSLTSLRLHFPQRWLVSKAGVLNLLSSLQQLEYLTIVKRGQPSPFQFQPFPISHPAIKWINDFSTSDACVPVVASCPCLQALNLPRMSATFDKMALQPNLRLPSLEMVTTNDFQSDLPRFIELLPNRHYLKTISDRAVCAAPSTWTLPTLYGITNLNLAYFEASHAMASALLPALPFLSILCIVLRGGISDWTWLKHGRLSNLKIDAGDPMNSRDETGGAPNESDFTVQIDQSTLPLLSVLDMDLSRHNVSKMTVSGLKQLFKLSLAGSFSMEDSSLEKIDLVISDCVSLVDLTFRKLNLAKFQLATLPTLHRLEFESCTAPQDFDAIQVGPLNRLEVRLDKTAPVEEEQYTKLRQIFMSKSSPDMPLMGRDQFY
jgi:hypothetical protein